jgi:hypothetical protein
MLRPREDVLRRAELDDPPGVHHGDPVDEPGDDAEIMRHPDDRHPRLGVKRLHEVEDLLLDRDVEGRGRLVCNQQPRRGRKPHRDHHPLQHPAGELVRIRGFDPLGVREADLAQHLARAVRRPRPVDAVGLERLLDLRDDAQQRVQRAHRILVDHRHLAAAHLAQALGADAKEVLAREVHLAAHDLELRGKKLQYREHRQRLAGAAFADDGELLAGRHVEVDAPDQLDAPLATPQSDAEPTDREERVGHVRGVRTVRRLGACAPSERRSGEVPGTTEPRIEGWRAPVQDGTVAGSR